MIKYEIFNTYFIKNLKPYINELQILQKLLRSAGRSLGGFLPVPQSQEENEYVRSFGDTHLGFVVGDGRQLRTVC